MKYKDKQDIARYSHLSPEEFPAELQRRLQEDPLFREQFEQMARSVKLLKIKQFETPEEAFDGRVRYKVITRIRNGEQADRRLDSGILESLSPYMRYSLGGLCLMLIGFTVLIGNKLNDHPAEQPAAPAIASTTSVDTVPMVETAASSIPGFISLEDAFRLAPTAFAGDNTANGFIGMNNSLARSNQPASNQVPYRIQQATGQQPQNTMLIKLKR